MPFMKGFGEGFSSAFAQRQQLDAQAERDAFAISYETYTKNKAQYDADKKKDETLKQQAKDLVKGLPNVDPNAWTYAYDQLKLGFNVGQVEDKLLTTKFAPIPTTPIPTGTDAAANPTTPAGAAQPVDPMASTDPTMAPQQPEFSKPTMTSNPFTNIGKRVQSKIAEIGNPQLQAQNQAQTANDKVKGIVGDSYDAAMQVFTPEPVTPLVQPVAPSVSPLAEFGLDKGPLTKADLARVDSESKINLKSDDPELKAKALRWLAMRADVTASDSEGSSGGVDANGNPILNPSLEKDIATIAGGTETVRNQLSQRKAFLLSVQDTAKELDALLQKNGGLNTWGAKLGSSLDELKDNMLSVVNFGDQMLGTGFSGDLENWINQATKGNPKWKEMSADERAFASTIMKLQYTYSRNALGQSGNSQSNQDIERMRQIIANSVGPAEIVQNLKNLIIQDANAINHEIENIITGSPELQTIINMQKQAYNGKSLYEDALGPLTPEQMAWANSETPEMSISGTPPEAPAPINNPTPEQTGALIGKGVIETEEQLADIKAATGSDDWKIGDTYTEYENGFDKGQ